MAPPSADAAEAYLLPSVSTSYRYINYFHGISGIELMGLGLTGLAESWGFAKSGVLVCIPLAVAIASQKNIVIDTAHSRAEHGR